MDFNLGTVPAEVKEDFINKRYDECLNSCNAILIKEPANGIALMYKALIFQEQGKHSEAMEFFNRLVDISPNFYPAWECKGMSELGMREYESAVESFKRTAELSPHRAQPWCYIALGYYMQDKKDVAVFVLDKVEDMVEDKSKLFLIKGVLQERKGEIDAAFMSYLQSQILSNEIDKEVAATKIYKMLRGNQ